MKTTIAFQLHQLKMLSSMALEFGYAQHLAKQRLEKTLANPNIKPRKLKWATERLEYVQNRIAESDKLFAIFSQEAQALRREISQAEQLGLPMDREVPSALETELTRLKAMLAEAMKERIKGLEEHAAFMDQMHERMAEDGLGIEEFLSRQSLSVRISVKHRSN